MQQQSTTSLENQSIQPQALEEPISKSWNLETTKNIDTGIMKEKNYVTPTFNRGDLINTSRGYPIFSETGAISLIPNLGNNGLSSKALYEVSSESSHFGQQEKTPSSTLVNDLFPSLKALEPTPTLPKLEYTLASRCNDDDAVAEVSEVQLSSPKKSQSELVDNTNPKVTLPSFPSTDVSQEVISNQSMLLNSTINSTRPTLPKRPRGRPPRNHLLAPTTVQPRATNTSSLGTSAKRSSRRFSAINHDTNGVKTTGITKSSKGEELIPKNPISSTSRHNSVGDEKSSKSEPSDLSEKKRRGRPPKVAQVTESLPKPEMKPRGRPRKLKTGGGRFLSMDDWIGQARSSKKAEKSPSSEGKVSERPRRNNVVEKRSLLGELRERTQRKRLVRESLSSSGKEVARPVLTKDQLSTGKVDTRPQLKATNTTSYVEGNSTSPVVPIKRRGRPRKYPIADEGLSLKELVDHLIKQDPSPSSVPTNFSSGDKDDLEPPEIPKRRQDRPHLIHSTFKVPSTQDARPDLVNTDADILPTTTNPSPPNDSCNNIMSSSEVSITRRDWPRFPKYSAAGHTPNGTVLHLARRRGRPVRTLSPSVEPPEKPSISSISALIASSHPHQHPDLESIIPDRSCAKSQTLGSSIRPSLSISQRGRTRIIPNRYSGSQSTKRPTIVAARKPPSRSPIPNKNTLEIGGSSLKERGRPRRSATENPVSYVDSSSDEEEEDSSPYEDSDMGITDLDGDSAVQTTNIITSDNRSTKTNHISGSFSTTSDDVSSNKATDSKAFDSSTSPKPTITTPVAVANSSEGVKRKRGRPKREDKDQAPNPVEKNKLMITPKKRVGRPKKVISVDAPSTSTQAAQSTSKAFDTLDQKSLPGLKKKPGRPRKSPTHMGVVAKETTPKPTSKQVSEALSLPVNQPASAISIKRKRGRPKKFAALLNNVKLNQAHVEETDNSSKPVSKMIHAPSIFARPGAPYPANQAISSHHDESGMRADIGQGTVPLTNHSSGLVASPLPTKHDSPLEPPTRVTHEDQNSNLL